MNKLSVAMTTYNGARFLLPQLQSLLEQTMQPDEVVICDDCSTDDTVQILHQFIQDHNLQHWRIIKNRKNLGYLENFRQAMLQTTGDIVFLCDQDDVWHKQKIEKMASIMESNPSITALACGYHIIDKDGAPITSYKKFYVPPSQCSTQGLLQRVRQGKVLYYNIAQGCAGAFHRTLLESYCTLSNCTLLPHDWALNLMAYEHDQLYFLNEELLSYRIHGSNTIGIDRSGQMIHRRIPRLTEYRDTILDSVNLPISKQTKAEIRQIAEFTDVRIQWLQNRRFSIWIKGFFRYFPIVKNYFFLQYAKDFVLVFFRTSKSPAKPEV